MRIVFKMVDNKGAARKIFVGKRVRFCHVNAVRTSFWNETNSGMKLILVCSRWERLFQKLFAQYFFTDSEESFTPYYI